MMVQPKNPDDWVAERCLVPPLIPQTWFAERPFFGWWGLNSVQLKDRHNNHWGTVVSKWIDWSNPFGMPGFDFWLKRQGSDARGWHEFFDVWGTNYMLIASSTTNWIATESTIFDCKGVPIIWVNGNVVYDTDAGTVGPNDGIDVYGSKVKAGFYLSAGNFERNMMMIYDLAMPPNELVRLLQTEPCDPFPPFCSTMPAWSPFLANHWSGEVLQKDFGEEMGKYGHVRVTANGATDIRFLALYGTHVFAPTRFAPCIYWTIFTVILSSCCGCFYWCCCTASTRTVAAKPVEFQGEHALAEADMSTMGSVTSQQMFGIVSTTKFPDASYQTPWGSLFTRARPLE